MEQTDARKTEGPDALAIPPEEAEERPFEGEETDFRILLEPAAHEAVLRHGAENPDVESCGVLVGRVCRDARGPYLHVSHIIEGKEARQESDRVRFTHSTWEHIHRELDARHPGRRIVGWYHMHPGFGVFLSEMDRFVHTHFFGAAWQVALVLDPKAMRTGLFHWEKGEIVRARRYWIGAAPRWDPPERLPASAAPPQENRPAPRPGTASGEAAGTQARPETPPAWPWIALLLAACLLLAFWNLHERLLRFRLESQLDQLRVRWPALFAPPAPPAPDAERGAESSPPNPGVP